MRILHIGLPKSGTTFLQRNLFSTLGESDGYFVSYPKKRGSKRVWHALEEVISGENGAAAWWLRERLDSHENFIISFEGLLFHSTLNEETLPRLAQFFGPGTTLLVTLRFEEAYLASKYQQAVKAGLTRSQMDFFFPGTEVRSGALRNFPILLWHPDLIIESGRNNFWRVLVVPSNSFDLPSLTHILGLPSSTCSAEAGKSRRKRFLSENRSLTPSQVRITETLNAVLTRALNGLQEILPAPGAAVLSNIVVLTKAYMLNLLPLLTRTRKKVRLDPRVSEAWKSVVDSNPMCHEIWISARPRDFKE